jgi:hypothetical protein
MDLHRNKIRKRNRKKLEFFKARFIYKVRKRLYSYNLFLHYFGPSNDPMLNFFNKSGKRIPVRDVIFISEAAKFQGILAKWKENKKTILVFWFAESLDQAASFFQNQAGESVQLSLAKELTPQQVKDSPPVFGEHYPLEITEQALFKRLNLENVPVYSALNEPFFKVFGADSILRLVQKSGIKENESLEHKMISLSIRKAQQKLEKKLLIENTAHSQAEWFKKNIRA